MLCRFLFEGYFGTVFYTGDCRIDGEGLVQLQQHLQSKHVDVMFADTTFCTQHSYELPTRVCLCSLAKLIYLYRSYSSSQEQAIAAILEQIEVTRGRVFLQCEVLGFEPILIAVAAALDIRIGYLQHTAHIQLSYSNAIVCVEYLQICSRWHHCFLVSLIL